MTASRFSPRESVARALAEAFALVFPVDCASCAAPGWGVCPACRAELRPALVRRRLADAAAADAAAADAAADDAVAVWSGLPFDGVAARVVRALKEQGRTGLARELAPALAAAAEAALAAASSPSPSPVVVPVPTSRAAFRRRGYRVGELLARRAGLTPVRLLVPARAAADQRLLGRGDRARNVAGTMRARGAAGCRVLVVDDVVTTGATLGEAIAVLRAAGASVVGAATVAATPRRSAVTDRPFQTHT